MNEQPSPGEFHLPAPEHPARREYTVRRTPGSAQGRRAGAQEGKRLALYTAVLLGAWFAIHTGVVLWVGFRDDLPAVADVAVVLGSKVERNGRPSPSLQARLEKGVKLYRSGVVNKVIVSGGLGKEGFEEADVMRAFLLEQGVPDQDILVDRGGYNTCQTALSTARVMQQNGWQSAIVVSQYYHLLRSRLAFRQAGVPSIYSAYAWVLDARDPYEIVREFVAYYVYLGRGCTGTVQ